MTRDPAETGKLREQQADGERYDHQHEYGAARREDERSDVEVTDHRLARGEYDAAADPGHERRKDREAEQLHEQMKGERLAPVETKVSPGAGYQRFVHAAILRGHR